VVHRVGPADKTAPAQGFGSTHVLLRVVDPTDGKDDLFLVYLHLDSIAEGVIHDAQVRQGDVIGAVGQEDATYPHLHFEFRKGGPEQRHSVHPLNYLPYRNEFNFTQPDLDRFNFYKDDGEKLAVRIYFEDQSRQEGDLRGVDVELTGNGVARQFHVDFNDRETINSDKGDEAEFKNGIAVEGYQKSNLQGEKLDDLHYGVIVGDIGPEFKEVKLQVLDVNNLIAESVELELPKLESGEKPVNERQNFEDDRFPPPRWEVKLLSGNVCRPDVAAALQGQKGLLCKDLESSSETLIRTALRFALPAHRMSWRLGANIRPAELKKMKTCEVIYPLALLADDNLVAAAQLRKIRSNKFVAGVLIRSDDGFFRERIDVNDGEIFENKAVRWELDLLRLGTRQTTAVLRLDNNVVARINGETREDVKLDNNEVSRLNGETRDVEPDNACVGILHRHKGLRITLHIDRLVLTEKPRF
jgi:hypothetical protein